MCAGLVLLASSAYGQDARKAFSISMTTSSGLLVGEGFEYVYDQGVSTNYKVSELDWPFQPLFYTGAALSLSSRMGIFASLDLKQGLSGKTGTMSDSDFLNGDGVKTNLSESDCYSERDILLDLKLGYDLPLHLPFILGVYAGFSYMDFKWSARDGYYQYPTSGDPYTIDPATGTLTSYGTYTQWSADETKTPLYGTGILYEQAYVIGSLGLRASYRLLDALIVGASFSFSPLAYCSTEDNHELRLVDFYSTLSGGFVIEPGLSLEYTIKPGASLKLSVDYRQLFNLMGDITQVEEGTTSTASDNNYFAGPDSASTSTNGSGAALWMLDASLLFRLEL
ncbi:MAG: omptin family outer membrane protease [Spirochaetia bacterium]|jgi:outer membrane protease